MVKITSVQPFVRNTRSRRLTFNREPPRQEVSSLAQCLPIRSLNVFLLLRGPWYAQSASSFVEQANRRRQIEDKFTSYGKETLTKLVDFVQVISLRLICALSDFAQNEVLPAAKLAEAQLPEDERRWKTVIPIVDELKVKARKQGLWNLFLSKAHYPKYGVPLTNLEVGPFRDRSLCTRWSTSW